MKDSPLITATDLVDGDGFEAIARNLGITYTLTEQLAGVIHHPCIIAHNSVGCILPKDKSISPIKRRRPRAVDFNWKNVPTQLKLLFSQNVDVSDPRVFPLPIGLERRRRCRWVSKHEKIIELRNTRTAARKMAYLNVNPRTNIQSRPCLINYMRGRKWCTTEIVRNGIDFVEYARQILDHKFVLCPDGHGIDTHRTWETLYLGRIPIVQKHVFTEYFASHLPMVVINDWEEVTEEYLVEQHATLRNQDWNWNILKISYWQQFIEKKVQAAVG